MSEFVDHIRSSILEDATLHTPYTYHGEGDGHTRSKTERRPGASERRLTGGGHPCTTTVKATWPICIALHTTSESRMFSLKLFVKTKKNTYARRQPGAPRRRECAARACNKNMFRGAAPHICLLRHAAGVWDS